MPAFIKIGKASSSRLSTGAPSSTWPNIFALACLTTLALFILVSLSKWVVFDLVTKEEILAALVLACS